MSYKISRQNRDIFYLPILNFKPTPRPAIPFSIYQNCFSIKKNDYKFEVNFNLLFNFISKKWIICTDHKNKKELFLKKLIHQIKIFYIKNKNFDLEKFDFRKREALYQAFYL